jgi:hypothetical protein
MPRPAGAVPAPVIHARLGSEIRLEQAELTLALAAALKHAPSMRTPVFYEQQGMRASTWNVPRFPYSFDETIDGGLILPRRPDQPDRANDGRRWQPPGDQR